MKNIITEKIEVARRPLLLALLFLAALAVLWAPAPCRAQAGTAGQVYQGNTFVLVTNQPATVAPTVTTNINSWVRTVSGKGLSISWRFNQASAGTSNCTLNVYSSVDGTNISTSPFATLTAAATGTTDVIANTNWSGGQCSQFNALVIGSIANTTSITTLTNKSIIVRRE